MFLLDCGLGLFTDEQRLVIATAATGAVVALFTAAAAAAGLAAAYCVKRVREYTKWSE